MLSFQRDPISGAEKFPFCAFMKEYGICLIIILDCTYSRLHLYTPSISIYFRKIQSAMTFFWVGVSCIPFSLSYFSLYECLYGSCKSIEKGSEMSLEAVRKHFNRIITFNARIYTYYYHSFWLPPLHLYPIHFCHSPQFSLHRNGRDAFQLWNNR